MLFRIFTRCLFLLVSLSVSLTLQADKGYFDERDIRILQSLSLSALPRPPAAPSNNVADHELAVEFGRQVFFDARFGKDGHLSCASCHQPELAFTDGEQRGKGVGETARNTPTLIGAAYQRWFYWDGRRDSLWSQALIPFEAPEEMGSSRLSVLRVIGKDERYRAYYSSLFGSFPSLEFANLPDEASPYGSSDVQNNWYRLSKSAQTSINRAFSNIGKVLEAFQRTLQPEPSKFDHFVDALTEGQQDRALSMVSESQLLGAKLFIDQEKTQCLQCHNGPMLTNGGFHNIGTGVFSGPNMDYGRVFGLQSVLMDEFNCLGKYSDADPSECTDLKYLSRDKHQGLQGAFKVPTLRFLNKTGPYFHDGRFDQLKDVMDYYMSPPKKGLNGQHELRPLKLTTEQRDALVEFLWLFSAPSK
ncbi:MAG: hypothetical protein CME36_15135 [unclassified Hahellaceae]|nr:hypothetical protein [Hahellaceae bacterium]|tara:strand:+ start:12592 stop:13839 length:1248 start_codon:yes stop_codon:yes gene_type:complete